MEKIAVNEKEESKIEFVISVSLNSNDPDRKDSCVIVSKDFKQVVIGVRHKRFDTGPYLSAADHGIFESWGQSFNAVGSTCYYHGKIDRTELYKLALIGISRIIFTAKPDIETEDIERETNIKVQYVERTI